MPSNLNFNAGVDFINQVVTYERIPFWGYLMDMIKSGSQDESSSNKKKGKKPEIAFGRKFEGGKGTAAKNVPPSALGVVVDDKHYSRSPQRNNVQLPMIEGSGGSSEKRILRQKD